MHFPKDALICRAWQNSWIIGALHQIQCAVQYGLCQAGQCIEMYLGGYQQSVMQIYMFTVMNNTVAD